MTRVQQGQHAGYRERLLCKAPTHTCHTRHTRHAPACSSRRRCRTAGCSCRLAKQRVSVVLLVSWPASSSRRTLSRISGSVSLWWLWHVGARVCILVLACARGARRVALVCLWRLCCRRRCAHHLLPSSSTAVSMLPSSPGTVSPRASAARPAVVASCTVSTQQLSCTCQGGGGCRVCRESASGAGGLRPRHKLDSQRTRPVCVVSARSRRVTRR